MNNTDKEKMDTISTTITAENIAADFQNSNNEQAERGFGSLSRHEKRFHILFYILVGVTALIVFQVIWQIAELTAR